MRKFFAGVFSFIIVFPLLLSAMAVISVTTFALDQDFYLNALDQPQVYETFLSSQMINALMEENLGFPPGSATAELEAVLKDILTPQYMRAQLDNLISHLFDYLRGEQPDFQPTIDIAPIKQALDGPQQDAFLTALVAAIPVCQPGQVPGFGSADQAPCKPAGVPDQLLIDQLLKPALPVLLAQVPDEVPARGEWINVLQASDWRRFIPGMAGPASLMLTTLFLVFVAVSFWYLTALIAGGSWRLRLQWLGWTLLIPAVLVFLIGFSAQSTIPSFWVRYAIQQAKIPLAALEGNLDLALDAVAKVVLARVASSFTIVGGISGALSIALVFWGLATPRRQ